MIARLILALLFFLVSVPAGLTAGETVHAANPDATALDDRFTASFEASVPMLRPAVVVHSDLVTLGDLFDHAGMLAETPVFRAPAPGTRGSVETHRIVEAARAAGLDRMDLAGLDTITVERAGIRLLAGDLEALVIDTLNRDLTARLGAGSGGYHVVFRRSPEAVMVGAEIARRLRVDLLARPSNRSMGFSAVVRTPAGDVLAQLDGQAEHRIAVPVLTRAVPRGDVVRASDLRFQDMAYARTLGTPTLVDTADIVGQAARRTLRAGAPVNPDDLTEPLMVERQDLVTLVYRHGALALTVRARALDDGAHGQSVDVMNLQSNRTVRGVVAGHGLIHVLGAMQDIASPLLTTTAQAAEIIQ